MKPVEIYPFDTPYEFVWNFVYLHGKAECIMEQEQSAPDLFRANQTKPTQEGNYLCSINGELAVAVLAIRHGLLTGRVALLSDSEALKHALTPEDWG